jgi:NAD(P)-dependent dehydrogenase (short-subunit alcohol dehydrogenase family)
VGRLERKVCVITGAGSGLGRETAIRFAAEGARVACAELVERSGRETVEQIRATGGEAAFFAADVADETNVAALYEAVSDWAGSIDVLVNNAGIVADGDGSVTTTAIDTWERTLGINLTGVFLCCKHGIPRLLASGGGSVVNIASFVALMGAAIPQIAYTASKGGVVAMTREVAVEFARQGIRANAICPGPIETPLLNQILAATPGALERRMVHIPTGRFGRADDIANAALFLASEESGWITGTAFLVDGGITAAYLTPE